MQPSRFFNVVRWLKKLLSAELQQNLLEGNVFRELRADSMEAISKSLRIVLDGALELSRSQVEIHSNPDAEKVLTTFGLLNLGDPKWIAQLAQSAIMPFDVKNPVAAIHAIAQLLDPVAIKWRALTALAESAEKLLIPEAVLREVDFDEILTVELTSDSDLASEARNIASLITELQELHALVARALGEEDVPSLKLIFAESGTPFRFDFKGSGEIIKELKNIMVEVWDRIRFRKQDGQHETNRVVVESLSVVKLIASQVNEGTLTEEEAGILKQSIIRSTISVFDSGALPREIPPTQTVANKQLVSARHPKQLTVSPSSATSEIGAHHSHTQVEEADAKSSTPHHKTATGRTHPAKSSVKTRKPT